MYQLVRCNGCFKDVRFSTSYNCLNRRHYFCFNCIRNESVRCGEPVTYCYICKNPLYNVHKIHNKLARIIREEERNRIIQDKEVSSELRPMASMETIQSALGPWPAFKNELELDYDETIELNKMAYQDQLDIDDKFYAEKYCVNTIIDSLKVYDHISEYMNEYPTEFKKFNDEILEYYVKNKQTKRALKYKMFVRDLLQQLVDEAFDDQPQVEAYLAVGGSTVNGCGSIKADLDLCIVAKNPNIVDRNAALSSDVKKENEFDQNREFHVDILRKTYTIFLKHQKKFQYLRFVDVARVPIISCKLAHPYDDGTLIEINCNNIAGVYNSHLLHYYAKVDERFPMMALVLKVWGAKENIINPMDGRVNAYTMQCMIIHFLQCATYPPILPNLWKLFPEFFGGKTPIPVLEFFCDLPGNLPDFHEMKNEKTVGELIIAFFDYYAKFDYAHDAISLRNARIFPRYHLLPEFQHWLFFIEEVYDLLTIPKNLKQAYVLQEIISKFKNAVDYYLMLKQIPIFRLICPEDVKKMASDEYNKLSTKTH